MISSREEILKKLRIKFIIPMSKTCSGLIKTDMNGIKLASEKSSNIEVKIIKHSVKNNWYFLFDSKKFHKFFK